jgi:hypothetical protein
VRNTGERLHRAGDDHHAFAVLAATGDLRAEILVAMQRVGALAHVLSIVRNKEVRQLVNRGAIAELVAQEATPILGHY